MAVVTAHQQPVSLPREAQVLPASLIAATVEFARLHSGPSGNDGCHVPEKLSQILSGGCWHAADDGKTEARMAMAGSSTKAKNP